MFVTGINYLSRGIGKLTHSIAAQGKSMIIWLLLVESSIKIYWTLQKYTLFHKTLLYSPRFWALSHISIPVMFPVNVSCSSAGYCLWFLGSAETFWFHENDSGFCFSLYTTFNYKVTRRASGLVLSKLLLIGEKRSGYVSHAHNLGYDGPYMLSTLSTSQKLWGVVRHIEWLVSF